MHYLSAYLFGIVRNFCTLERPKYNVVEAICIVLTFCTHQKTRLRPQQIAFGNFILWSGMGSNLFLVTMESDKKRGSKGDDAPSYDSKNGPNEPKQSLKDLAKKSADRVIKTFKEQAGK